MKKATHKFIVLDVQENQFGPKVSLLSSFDNLESEVSSQSVIVGQKITFGMLILETKSLRCSITSKGTLAAGGDADDLDLHFAGLYLLRRIDSSVKIPICINCQSTASRVQRWPTWARSRLNPASNSEMISSKWPRYSYICTSAASSSYNAMLICAPTGVQGSLTAWTIICRPQI